MRAHGGRGLLHDVDRKATTSPTGIGSWLPCFGNTWKEERETFLVKLVSSLDGIARRKCLPGGWRLLAALGPPRKGVSGGGWVIFPLRGTWNLTFFRVPPTLRPGDTTVLSEGWSRQINITFSSKRRAREMKAQRRLRANTVTPRSNRTPLTVSKANVWFSFCVPPQVPQLWTPPKWP